MRTEFLIGVAAAAIMLPGAAFAQSTGTADFEGDIVITATKTKGVGGVVIPDTPKTKVQLDQAFIARQTPGQSIDEVINSLPGVSFQSQDPYGSSGGRLTIRGFGPDRISQTVDGIPLNDTGNYAIYSNQQIDPELIDSVNVSLGSTDVDSPTASASGSTVNYRTITPTDQFGVRVVGSIGDLNYFRVFGLVNTGTLTSFGTKAWFSAASSSYDVQFSNFGQERKDAYNFKIYQPIGSNGDFIAVAGNWNVNRNTNVPDYPLRNTCSGVTCVVGSGTTNRFPRNFDEAFLRTSPCQTAAARPGLADTPNTCGTLFEQNVNPSNTGSLRFSSRFTLAHGLILTVDPTIQYVKANGGLYSVNGREVAGPAGRYGFIGNTYYTGQDLNGDGDTLDTVKLDGTSQTVTHRYTILSSLRWDITDTQTFRLTYTHDYGRHRQSGELIRLQANGQPFDVFPINSPIFAPNGVPMEKRNRKSYAVLDQVSGEYRGEFGGLTVNLGVRAPWFKRNLHQYCFTTSAAGFLDCIAGSSADVAGYAAANPYSYNPTTNVVTGYQAPQFRQFTYNRLLPSAGLTYKLGGGLSVYASYSKGLQVPGTDNLYQQFYYPVGVGTPKPETTDNFDAGFRYATSKVQAFVGGWYTIFTNRLASSYDPVLDQTVYRNLGKVNKYGVDASISYRPIEQLTLYAFGSYLKSKIKDDVLGGVCSTSNVTNHTLGCTTLGADYYLRTAGKREAGAPTYTLGARAQVDVDPIEIGMQVKRTGPRYVNDQNVPIYSSIDTSAPTTTVLYGAKTPAYTVVDLDARVNMGFLGLNKTTYVQFNVTNLFNQFYVGNLGNPNSSYSNVPFAYLGSPRTASVSLNVQF
jgi:iron complex outermembrane receptor protein